MSYTRHLRAARWLAAVLALATAHAAGATTTYWVTNSGNFGPGSFAAALASLQPNLADPQEIRFAFPAGQTIYLNGPVAGVVGATVRIDGADMAGAVVIDGAGHQPLHVDAGSTTTRLTVANLSLRHGGAIGRGGCIAVAPASTTLVLDGVTVQDGTFAHNGDSMSFRELAGQLEVPVSVSASVFPSGFGPSFAVHIVDVEVDVETCKVEILRYTAVQDVGKAIHPAYVEGQLQGGAAQGVGWALNEEYVYDDKGRLLNASLLDYRMPTALDLPMIDTVLVEVANPGHPYGVRGVGEVPIVPPAAAVANAIYHAAGVRMTELPMSPARVSAALLAAAVPA